MRNALFGIFRKPFKLAAQQPFRFFLFLSVGFQVIFQPGWSWGYSCQLKVGLLESAIQIPAFYEACSLKSANILKNIDAQLLNCRNRGLISLKEAHRVNAVEMTNNLPNRAPEFSPSIGRFIAQFQSATKQKANDAANDSKSSRTQRKFGRIELPTMVTAAVVSFSIGVIIGYFFSTKHA